MQFQSRRAAKVLGVLVLALSTGSAFGAPNAKTAPATATAPTIEPQAKDVLQKMSTFLAAQPELSVRADGATQVVRDNGERLEFDHSSLVRMRRPNGLRSDRRGDVASASFYYDGKTFTLFGKEHQYYAQAPAPPTLDGAIEAMSARLGIDIPGADLLSSRPYDSLTEDAVSGTYIGQSYVGDAMCHHLAFRGNETDWEIWVDAGANPLPRKLVIISKKVKGAPEFRIHLSEWNLAPKLDDATFRFVPPQGAKKIDFMLPKGGNK